MGGATVGVPIKVLYEAVGHVVSMELKNGEVLRGTLRNAEDTMNCLLVDVTRTGRDGKPSLLDQVYVRGTLVRFFVLPDILRHAPMFVNMDPAAVPAKGQGAGVVAALGSRNVSKANRLHRDSGNNKRARR